MITFFSEDIDFELSEQEKAIDWISEAIESHEKELVEINYIFCSDEYLHQVNVEYLDHDTYTDIITFDYCELDIISGDIFVSVERVTENANAFGVDFEDELDRVLIHGVLHLAGYQDKSKEEANTMREKEDFYLSLRS